MRLVSIDLPSFRGGSQEQSPEPITTTAVKKSAATFAPTFPPTAAFMGSGLSLRSTRNDMEGLIKAAMTKGGCRA